jgi:AcrR family transcriptional regulator
VGVELTVLYKLFGDKHGLLAAVVDHVFEGYLAQERTQLPSADPAEDLYRSWDGHVLFASANPAVYRIAYSPWRMMAPAGAEEFRQLLYDRLVRCAEAGRLRVTPGEAAQAFMAACLGVELSLLLQPGMFSHPDLSQLVRDAILREMLIGFDGRHPDRQAAELKSVALQMATMIKDAPSALTDPEVAVMLQWLDVISVADEVFDNGLSEG